VPVQPKTIVYLRPDTIGDLILFTPALGLFMAEWPKARHIIVVREGYESLAPLFPAALEWKVARLNPFRQRPSGCRRQLASLLAELAAAAPDLILAPTLNRTWLEIAVAAHFRGIRSVVLGGAEVDPLFAASLRLDLGVDPAAAFGETVASDKSVGDVENQHRFAENLIGRKVAQASCRPSTSRRNAAVKARAIASKHGLAAGQWAAVFAGRPRERRRQVLAGEAFRAGRHLAAGGKEDPGPAPRPRGRGFHCRAVVRGGRKAPAAPGRRCGSAGTGSFRSSRRS
jgi:hypothetical protein